ncbi:GIY-YIG nuclease family protein [Staphylococcus argensis]|uniref:GIY-YIG nuclease family protein n=1 Tax=Staphylococcus argensis TaxID=1607738 RepID=UPI00142DD2C2|nr:helix-turn-helix domain-containing protein [Staphylococcus argensis]MCY6991208.1 helix-turn-helix domain-containing protein [Staphylococcus argensis]
MNRKSCIYKITNVVNGKVYVGQTVNYSKRKAGHFSYLRRGAHRNHYLQKAFNKYGEASFKIKVIKECNINELDKLELFYMKKYNSLDRAHGYNLLIGGTTNKSFPDCVREKMSRSQKDRIISEEHRKRISEQNKGKKMSSASIEKTKKTKKDNQIQWGETNPNAVLSNDDVEKLIVDMLNGMTVKDAMKKYRCSRQTVYGIVQNRTYKAISPNLRDKLSNLNEKNKKDTLNKIIPMYLNGVSQNKISQKLGISRNTVSKILNENNINTRFYKNQFRSQYRDNSRK